MKKGSTFNGNHAVCSPAKGLSFRSNGISQWLSLYEMIAS